MYKRRGRHGLGVAALISAAATAAARAGTLRVAAYNVDLDTGTTTPNSSIAQVLSDVGNETAYDGKHPLDIIGLEETTSNATSVAPIVTALNASSGATAKYAMSAYQGTQSGDPTDGNGPNALIYNTQTLTMVTPAVGVGTPMGSTNGEYRQVIRYEFQPLGGTAAQDFYVYVLHSKSGSSSASDPTNGNDRALEATTVLNDEKALQAAAPASPISAIVMGDFNIDGTNENVSSGMTASYQQFNAGGFRDPLNPNDTAETYGSGATAYNSILTESTQTSFSYRDDLQLDSGNVYNGSSTALNYIAGTEHAFGNNGSVSAGGTFNTSSTDPYRAELYAATDHLPIVADYSFVSAPEPTTLLTVGLGAAALLLPRRRRPLTGAAGRRMFSDAMRPDPYLTATTTTTRPGR